MATANKAKGKAKPSQWYVNPRRWDSNPYVAHGMLVGDAEYALRKNAIDAPDEMGTELPVLDREADRRELERVDRALTDEELFESRPRLSPKQYNAWTAPVRKDIDIKGVPHTPDASDKVARLRGDIDDSDADIAGLERTGTEGKPASGAESLETLPESVPNGYKPETLFSKLMDTRQPAYYADAGAKYANADSARGMFLFTGNDPDAKNAQEMWKARAKDELERAQSGYENELQRRQAAENMWGHYSPAITQAITNAAIFTQKSYQLEEESRKMRKAAEIDARQLQQDNEVLSQQYDIFKDSLYKSNARLNGMLPDRETFKKIVDDPDAYAELSDTLVGRGAGKESMDRLSDLVGKMREINRAQAVVDNQMNEAQLKTNEARQAMSIAATNNAFAKRGHEAFGFPSLTYEEMLSLVGKDDDRNGLRNSGLGEKARYGEAESGQEQGNTSQPAQATDATPRQDGGVQPQASAGSRKNAGALPQPSAKGTKPATAPVSENAVPASDKGTEPEKTGVATANEFLADYLSGKTDENSFTDDARRERWIRGMNSNSYTSFDMDVLNKGTKDNQERINGELIARLMAGDAARTFPALFNFSKSGGTVSANLHDLLRKNKLYFLSQEGLLNEAAENNMSNADYSRMTAHIKKALDGNPHNLEEFLTYSGYLPVGWKVNLYGGKNGERQLAAVPPGYVIVQYDRKGESVPVMVPEEVGLEYFERTRREKESKGGNSDG